MLLSRLDPGHSSNNTGLASLWLLKSPVLDFQIPMGMASRDDGSSPGCIFPNPSLHSSNHPHKTNIAQKLRESISHRLITVRHGTVLQSEHIRLLPMHIKPRPQIQVQVPCPISMPCTSSHPVPCMTRDFPLPINSSRPSTGLPTWYMYVCVCAYVQTQNQTKKERRKLGITQTEKRKKKSPCIKMVSTQNQMGGRRRARPPKKPKKRHSRKYKRGHTQPFGEGQPTPPSFQARSILHPPIKSCEKTANLVGHDRGKCQSTTETS